MIILFVCFRTFSLSGQSLKIVDHLVPLNYVTVFNQDSTWYAISDDDGMVDISSLTKPVKLIITHLGYAIESITVSDSRDVIYEIGLVKNSKFAPVVSILASRIASSHPRNTVSTVSINQIDVKLKNPQTAADLLGQSGEVFIQKSQQGGGSPMIRGFSANRLLYAVDGVRMNNAVFRSGNLQNVINLDPFSIMNTQVLFGPNSVMYGSDAIGGVMNFKTISTDFSESENLAITGNFNGRYSSANKEITSHFDLGLAIKKWSLMSSITRWRYDDLKQGKYGPDEYLKPFHVIRRDEEDVVVAQDDPLLQIPTAYEQLNVLQKIKFQPSFSQLWEYAYHHSETSSFGRYDRHNRLINGLPRYAEWDYGPQIWTMHHVHFRSEKAYKIYDFVDINFAYQKFEESRIVREFNDNNRRINHEKVDAFTANIDFVKSISLNSSLRYGLEYVYNVVDSEGVIENILNNEKEEGPSRYPQSNWESLAAYVKQEYRLSDHLLIEAGLRYNHISLNADFNSNFYPLPFEHVSLSDGALNYSLGTLYRTDKNISWSTNFGTAFRAPNVDDVGKIFDSEPGAVVVPNPLLKSEYAYNIESSITYDEPESYTISFTGYYSYLNHALIRRDYQLNGQDSIFYDGVLSKVQAIQNASFVRIMGFQSNISFYLKEYLRLTSIINYQIGNEELDNGELSPSRHAPPLFGNVNLSYQKDKLQGFIQFQFQDQKSYDELPVEERNKDEIYAKNSFGNNYAPAWYSLDFKCLYKVVPTFSISVGVENITDRRYRSYSSGVSAPGRNCVISLSISL